MGPKVVAIKVGDWACGEKGGVLSWKRIETRVIVEFPLKIAKNRAFPNLPEDFVLLSAG